MTVCTVSVNIVSVYTYINTSYRLALSPAVDVLSLYSSLPPQGTAAMRNTKRGSWFIQELNLALRLHARDTHLADILVQVTLSGLHLHMLCLHSKLCFFYLVL